MEVIVKKLTVFALIAVLIAGAAFAQADKPNRQERGERRLPQQEMQRHQQQQQDNSVSIEGTLKLEKGFVAVQSGESVYLVPMLNRYIGFISGLKEGEKVSIEGREFKKMIQPVKVTIGEKFYDFPAPVNYRAPRCPAPAFGKQGFNQRPDNRNFERRYDRKKPDHGRKGGYDRGKSR